MDDADRDRILKQHANGRGNPEITRFKGLGEMMPKTLWQTTLDPASRRLLRVEISEPVETDRTFNEIMGKDPALRYALIMEHGAAADLDL